MKRADQKIVRAAMAILGRRTSPVKRAAARRNAKLAQAARQRKGKNSP